MKQRDLKLCLLTLLAAFCCAPAISASVKIGKLYYNLNGTTKTAVVTYYSNNSSSNKNYVSGDLVIPSTIEYNGTTYSVTMIGNSAFYGCSNLSSVSIPNTVTSIDSYAFNSCSRMTAVTIPNSVTSIGSRAFSYCSGLRSVTIPNSVTTIGDYAFSSCSGLNSVTIPNSVTSIGSSAFYNTNIKKAIWLKNTPPTGASNVGATINYVSNNQYSFSNQIVYPSLSSKFEVDNVVYVPVSPSERTCDVIDCNYNPTSKTVTIDSVVSNRSIQFKVLNIKTYAFYDNVSITGLIVNNRGNIGNYAFSGCTAMKSVEAGNNGNIGDYAFSNCIALSSVKANNNGNIGNYAFSGCTAITSVIANNNGYIDGYAFSDCKAITSVKANNNGHIGDNTFSGCTALKSVEISNNGKIGNYAFSGCTALTSAVVDNHGAIGNYAFSGCNMVKSLTLGSDVTSIGNNAFYNNNRLKTVVIPDSVTTIGSSAFEGCSSLDSVTIGKGLTVMSASSFKNCSSLTSLIIPANIKTIGDYVFSGCTKLADVTFEDSKSENTGTNNTTQTYPSWTSTNHSNSSTSSTQYDIEVKSGDTLSFEIWSDSEAGYDVLTVYLNGAKLASVNGLNAQKTVTYTFNESGTFNLKVEYVKDSSQSHGTDQAGIRNIIVYSINGSLYDLALGSNGSSPLFADCPLDEVYIGRKLSYKTSSSYGYSPFYRNRSLRSVKITDKETEICDNEFYDCSNLQSFECGDGVTKIGKWAFSGCTALQSYASGTSVVSIGNEAFSDCTGLISFTSYAAAPPVCGNQALDDINKWECTLYVLPGSVDDYKAADQWKEFFFIEENAGVEDVVVDQNTDSVNAPIYDIMGRKVSTTTPGRIYIQNGRKFIAR